jgi:ketosteroid isomerase-like protein
VTDDATRIVESYFDAWRAGDPEALRTLLADDATFAGPLGRSANAAEYREAIGLVRDYDRHRDREDAFRRGRRADLVTDRR